MNDNYKPKVVMFLGAGASRPLGIPTTKEFFNDKCYEKFKEKDAFLKIAEELKTTPDSVDIEQVLIKLENAKAVVNDSILQNRKDWEARVSLEFEIRDVIYKKCSNFDRKKCIDHYTGLFTNIFPPDFISKCSIFTTNYDRSLEYFFRCNIPPRSQSGFLTRFGSATQLWDGFIRDGEGGLVWSENGYGPTEKTMNDKVWNIPLYKMHGSIGWLDTKQKVVEVSSEFVYTAEYNPLLIFPGFKGLPDHRIFGVTRLKLRQELETADNVAVIGFSFRDDYIAEIFNQAIIHNKNLKITSIMPDDWPYDSKINNFPNLKSRITPIKCCFGKKSGQIYAELLKIDYFQKDIRPTKIFR